MEFETLRLFLVHSYKGSGARFAAVFADVFVLNVGTEHAVDGRANSCAGALTTRWASMSVPKPSTKGFHRALAVNGRPGAHPHDLRGPLNHCSNE
jgi:hypothetical protein